MKLPDPPLLLVTDRRQARLPLKAVVVAALSAGCRWVSIREKDLPHDEQALLAQQLLPSIRAAGACLTLHGPAALAKLAGVDGVHLPSHSNAAEARALLGLDKIIGVSIHTVTDAEALDPAWADYAVAGPAFETLSKPGYGPGLGSEGLAEIVRAAPVPVLAIGGINPVRIGELVAAGGAGVAVMGGVMRAADPAQRVCGLIASLNGSLALHRAR